MQTGNVLSCIDNGVVYFMPSYTDKKERSIYLVDLDGRSKEPLTIREDGIKGFKNERLIQFAVSGSNLIVLSNKSIHFFRRDRNSFQVVKTIKNSYSFDHIEKLGNSFLLHVCYSFHPMDQTETNLWVKLDMSSLEIGKLFTPEIDNSKFGSFVNSWVSTYERTIAHASTSQYKVMFYNDLFLPIDSIELSDELFKLDTGLINNADLYSKEGISNFMKLDDEKFSRIRKVIMLNSTQVLVFSKLSQEALTDKGKVRLDMWDKSSGVWRLQLQVAGDEIYKDGETYDDQHTFLGNLYQNVFDLRISNGQIYCVSFPYYPKVKTESFDRVKDIEASFKDSNEFHYGLEKFVFSNN
ncbi:hypothetical protein [Fluviicola chungangensis]|uniref:6-bladed beta-propeller n=1 Tax=Fluviicola chungangensis TaxID=2597671 RepID=A0A556N0D8_9FLAO|nr:hypothetical protein [Fluviicola chungangensis]TSJ45652.1 hypothetical protein FO442_07815 [Fluviicola chungangensis]